MNSLNLQRSKLYNELEIKNQGHLGWDCCRSNLSPEEIDLLDDCFQHSSKLTAIERSILYYIAGYVAHKEKCNVMLGEVPKTSDTEFTIMENCLT